MLALYIFGFLRYFTHLNLFRIYGIFPLSLLLLSHYCFLLVPVFRSSRLIWIEFFSQRAWRISLFIGFHVLVVLFQSLADFAFHLIFHLPFNVPLICTHCYGHYRSHYHSPNQNLRNCQSTTLIEILFAFRRHTSLTFRAFV